MPYGINVKCAKDDVGEIYIQGYITDEKWKDSDVTPKDLKAELDKVKGKKRINVFINSAGGGVWAGMAIHNMLQRHPGETYGQVDGLCASIASVVLQGCKTRNVTKNSLVMIHNPTTYVVGSANDMRKTADMLDKVKDTIVAAYMERTQTGAGEIETMMDAETWMTAEEAVAYGFADELEESNSASAYLRNNGMAVINGIDVDTARFASFPVDRLLPEPEDVAVDYSMFDKLVEVNATTIKLLEAMV